MTTPPDRRTILDQPIHTWQPMTPGLPYLAQIEGFNVTFRGDTPMRAARAAEEWRKQEWNRIQPRAKRVRVKSEPE